MITIIPGAKILRVSFSIAAVVIATANSLSATSNDPSISQQLASRKQSPDCGKCLPAETAAKKVEVNIENCESFSDDVRTRIAQARDVAMGAYTDSQLGVNSPHGFRAMFKNNSVMPEAILQAISVFRPLPGLKPHPTTSLEPRFACVTPDMAEKYGYLHLGYEPFDICNTKVTLTPQQDLQFDRQYEQDFLFNVTQETIFPTAFYAAGTAYIFLCPIYQSQSSSPSTNYCPSVDVEGPNVFLGSQNLFSRRYQLYTLINQLARFYLGESALSGNTTPLEHFDWNACVFDLGEDSGRNPTNMELYVALVAQQCTQAPEVRVKLSNGSYSDSQFLTRPRQKSNPINESSSLPPLSTPNPTEPATFSSSEAQFPNGRPGTTVSTSRRVGASDSLYGQGRPGTTVSTSRRARASNSLYGQDQPY
ncbi:hypothetical protein N7G274_003629 [Stereocaulon virgatum]|uniref:Uncharacterized protein n=1 Tax=Stereocaulon virgatum TaxID=373712 RepID=A0ABR4AE20_9LECA